jgi:hypothetical protein
MKKYLLALLFVFGPLKPAMADTVVAVTPPVVTNVPPVSPATPVILTTVADGFNIGNNGAALTLRDVMHGQWAVGLATALYKKYYISADGMVGYVPEAPGANAFYAPGFRFWAGQFLYEQVGAVKIYADKTALAVPLLQYLTVGGWATRDFQVPEWRGGWDAGITIRF